MTSLSRSTIDRWLAKVEDPPALHAGTHGFDQRDERTSPPVPADPPSDAPITATTTSHDQRRVYERQLRHKTKPNRYEYKSRSSTRQSSTNRRRTINDNFQAPNVSKARLTLPTHMNTGIFTKGKTSSPVKCRRSMPDLKVSGCLPESQLTRELAFSETDFLDKKLKQGADGKQEQDEAEANQPPTERPPSVGNFHNFLYQSAGSHMEAATGLHSSKSAFQIRSQPSIRDSDRDDYTIQLQDPGHRDDGDQDLRKADELHEAYTDRLLLSERMTESMALDTEKNYKSLEELKEILEERMKTWDLTTQAPVDSETRTQGNQGMCRRKRSLSSPLDSELMGQQAPKIRKCSHVRRCKSSPSELPIFDCEELCSSFKTPIVGESLGRVSDGQSNMNWRATSKNRTLSQLMEVTTASEPHCHIDYPESIQRELETDGLDAASHVGHATALASADSEALFAQTLDAAYNVIVGGTGTHYFPESYVRDAVPTIGPSETIATTNHSPADEYSEELLLLTQGENHLGQPQHGWSEPEWEPRDSRRKQVERLGLSTLDGVDAVNTDLEDGRLKGFWRRNKLY